MYTLECTPLDYFCMTAPLFRIQPFPSVVQNDRNIPKLLKLLQNHIVQPVETNRCFAKNQSAESTESWSCSDMYLAKVNHGDLVFDETPFYY